LTENNFDVINFNHFKKIENLLRETFYLETLIIKLNSELLNCNPILDRLVVVLKINKILHFSILVGFLFGFFLSLIIIFFLKKLLLCNFINYVYFYLF
jgi:hypothetical protein